MLEPHFSVIELAENWKLSDDFVRRQFRDEPGVIKWVRQRPGRRRYVILRIPKSVAERVYRRFMIAA